MTRFFQEGQFLKRNGQIKGVVTKCTSHMAEIQLIADIPSGRYLQNKKELVSNVAADYLDVGGIKKLESLDSPLKPIMLETFS